MPVTFTKIPESESPRKRHRSSGRRKRLPLKPVNFNKHYRNTLEAVFANLAREAGWQVTKKGWPDFICYKEGWVMFVEVKASGNHRLSADQQMLFDHLGYLGLDVRRWSPDEPINL